jgi:ferritin
MMNTLRTSLLFLHGVAAFAPTKTVAVRRANTGISSLFAATSSRSYSATASIASKTPTRPELIEYMNDQVTRELTASQTYLSASLWMERNELVGMARYMRDESDEERSHAMGFLDFCNKRDIPIALQALEAPKASWESVEQVWQDLLQAEEENTQALLQFASAAQKCEDHAITAFLQPYHLEQVESEDHLGTILAKVRDEKKTPGLLRQLDGELGADKSKIE